MRHSARILIAAAIMLATPALAQDDDDTSLDDIPHITIVGTAQSEVAPDLATITVAVTDERPTARMAAEDNARVAQAVIDAAKAHGVPPADIATQAVSLTQTFDEIRDPDGRTVGQRPRGFAAENVLAVRIRDLAKAGTLAESLIAKGANRFDGIAFSVEHPEPILARLTGEAVKNARAQAEQAAGAAGAHLGRVLLMQRPGTGDTPMRMASARMKAATPMAAPAMPVEAGTTTLASTIEVTWTLDPN